MHLTQSIIHVEHVYGTTYNTQNWLVKTLGNRYQIKHPFGLRFRGKIYPLDSNFLQHIKQAFVGNPNMFCFAFEEVFNQYLRMFR